MKTAQAIAKYGKHTCIDAYDLHRQGNGARTIGMYLNLTTAQADCAIDAGRDIASQDKEDDRDAEYALLINELEHNK
jgi:hypothetical protein